MRRPPSKCSRIAGMRLEALHLLERRQPGIAVVEPDDEAVGDQVLAEMIQERAAIGAGCPAASRSCARPGPGLWFSAGISHSSLMPMRVGLRIVAVAQVEAFDQPLRQRAAAALGEQRVAGAQLHAALEVLGRARRPCRCPCRRWRCRRCGRPPPAARRRRSRGRSPRPAPRPAGRASGRHCRARRCSCRGCASAAGWAGGRRASRSGTGSGRRAAGVSSGAPCSRQSGISSLSARGSSTAPDRIWAPTSPPFSTTQTAASGASCFSRIAAARPDGPGAHDHHVELHRLARGQLLRHRHLPYASFARIVRAPGRRRVQAAAGAATKPAATRRTLGETCRCAKPPARAGLIPAFCLRRTAGGRGSSRRAGERAGECAWTGWLH